MHIFVNFLVFQIYIAAEVNRTEVQRCSDLYFLF